MGTARARWAPILEGVFRNYSVVFVVLIAVAAFDAVPGVRSRFAWFGAAWVAIALARAWSREEAPEFPNANRTVILVGLALAVGVALLWRLLRLAHGPMTEGYDWGFYKFAFQTYEDSAPRIPEGELPPWIRLQFEPLLPLLHMALHLVAGLDAETHLRLLFPLLSSFLCVGVYAAARSAFGPTAALVSAGFYAASLTQLSVHQYLYEKNVLGLALLLALFVALPRRAWVASGLLLGALAVTHRPTLLLAAVAVAAYATLDLVRTRAWKGWALMAGTSLPLFLPIWMLRRDDYFGLGLRTVAAAGDSVGSASPEAGGTFLNFLQYQAAAAAYLPLATAGAFLLWRRSRLTILCFLLALANVVAQFVFYNRFIIMLDLVALTLAGASLLCVTPGRPRWVRPGAALTLVLLAAVPTVLEAQSPQGPPHVWVDERQMEGIRWLKEHAPADATVLASNLDAPYVLAESGRRTFAPGLLDDPHTGQEWRAFFTEQDAGEVRAFLAPYGRDVFVYHAEGHGPGLGTSKFTEPDFRLVYDEGRAKVWQFAA